MRILFLGHSLVEFGRWERRLPGHAVTSLGRAGETTAGLLARLERETAAHPAADAVLVMTGTNDLLAGDASFPETLRAVLRRLRRAYPAARVIVHGLLPLDASWAAPGEVADASAAIGSVAAEEGAEFLDLAGRFADAAGHPLPGLYGADGVHLTERGYRLWAAALEERLPV